MIKYDIVEEHRRYYWISDIERDGVKHYGKLVKCLHCGKDKFISDDADTVRELDSYCSRTCRNHKAIYNRITNRH